MPSRDSDIHAALYAAGEWYESKRSGSGNVNRNVMGTGIAVSQLIRDTFPLDEETVESKKGSQVKGLSGTMISKVLKSHGEDREFASEGGRTSRGTLKLAMGLAGSLNNALAPRAMSDEDRRVVATALEGFFVERIQVDYFDKQTMKVDINPSKPISRIVDDIFASANARSDKPAGVVAQHLVGAKLELRFPSIDVGRDKANAADQQTNRQGDFQIGNTAFHVTMSPMTKLVPRCRDNIANAYRPVVLVPEDKTTFARGLFESEGLADKVNVLSIESFVGTNIEELAQYETDAIKVGLARLVRRYNERIEAVESDQSLRIEEPEWLVSLLADEPACPH